MLGGEEDRGLTAWRECCQDRNRLRTGVCFEAVSSTDGTLHFVRCQEAARMDALVT